MKPEVREATLRRLPSRTGVYIFRGSAETCLYVGKATNLRTRVRSYFQRGRQDDRYFIDLLERELENIETIVTATEKEAALLENQLIKELRPRYNVKLRDDKDYLSLRLDRTADFPRLEVVRRPKPDGALYFGPYHSATSARQTLRLVNRHFQLRTCTDTEMRSRTRPCLQHQIKRCPAPCVLDVNREEYARQTELVGLFLDGRHDALVKVLNGRMEQASEEERYEQAGRYRDQLRAVERVHEEQHVTSVTDLDQDAVGLFRDGEDGELAILLVRGGKLVGVRTFELSNLSAPDDEVVAAFLADYYSRGTFVPDEVLLPVKIEVMKGLEELWTEQRQRRCHVLQPQRGPRTRLLRMAAENAAHAFLARAQEQKLMLRKLELIQEKLRLPRLPKRIECLDISHIGGTETVGAIVTLVDGAPTKKFYRAFHVRSVEGGDDYGAMREVLERRFRRAQAGSSAWEAPDLLVVDGGRGQLGVALAVIEELGIQNLALASIAKEKVDTAGETRTDRIFLPGQKNPVILRDSHPALTLLAVGRDEAHRFSNALRKKAVRSRTLRSSLDGVRGIGPRTRNILLRSLGSADAVMAAPPEKLAEVGLTKRQIAAVLNARTAWAATTGKARPNRKAEEDQAIENAFAEEPELL